MHQKRSFPEKWLFLILAIVNIYPVVAHAFFPTHDGASHLYNAICIKDLLLGNQFLDNYYSFNSFPFPNWMGHIILGVSSIFFPANIAEKVFLIVYLVGVPLSFRYLVRSFQKHNIAIAYLIFPFCFSYMFFLGFYNFIISFIFLFLTLGFWIRQNGKLNLKNSFVLFILISCTYFSHLSIYGLLLMILIAVTFFYDLKEIILRQINFAEFIRTIFKKFLTLFLVSAPTFILAVLFLSQKTSFEATYLPESEMFRNIKIIQPLIGYVQDESVYTKYIALTLALLVITTFLFRLHNFYRHLSDSRKFNFMHLFHHSDIWFILSSILLLGYFTLPDSDGWAGYFSLRILLLFFILLIVWLSQQNNSRVILIVSVIVVLFFHFNLMVFRDRFVRSLNESAVQIKDVANFIEPSSVVYTFNNSGNWLHAHMDKYAGITKPVVMLNNNEANGVYFPLKWNMESLKNLYAFKDSVSYCFFRPESVRSSKKIDYFLYLGQPDTLSDCGKVILKCLKEKTRMVAENDFAKLYKSK